MTDKQLDEFFSHKLKNYSAPVPPDMWERIMAERQKKPKAFWLTPSQKLMLAATFFIAALLLGFYFFNNTSQNKNTIEQNTTPAYSATPNNGNNATTEKDNSNLSINKTPNSINSSNSDVKANSNSVNINNIKANSTSIISSSKKSQSQTYSNLNSLTAKYKTVNNFSNDGDNLNSNNFSYNQVNAEPALKNSLLYNTNAIHLPPLNLRRILGLDACPNANGAQRNDWYIELYGSPDYTLKSITANGASANYLQKKDSTEHLRGGFTIGARFSKTIGEHTYLKLGIQYNQINEMFSQRKEDQVQTTTVIVRRTITTPQGITTTVTDTSSVTQIGYRIIKSMNHYKNVELPVMLGYEFGMPDANWHFTVNGGLIFGLSSWYMGETLDTSLQVVAINSKSNSGVYEHSFTTSIYGSLGIYRRITPQLDVFAEPYFRYNILGTNSLYGVNQRFGAAGISFGTRIQLNGRRQHL